MAGLACVASIVMFKPLCRLLVRVLPAPLAQSLVRVLVSRSRRPEVTEQQQAALAAATRISYGKSGSTVAWSWGSGPLVLFVHGWNGRAAQLAPLAQQIAWEGYRCVCLDVTAHGESAGRRPSWRHFIDDVADAAAHFGAVHAFIGHSAGGLAMIAAQGLKRMQADSYVCICAPSHPFPPIRAIEQLLDPPSNVLEACRNDIADQFETTWDRLEKGILWKSVEPLLLLYDFNDRFIDHTEGDRISRWAPHARLHKTAGHGHTRVLASDDVARCLLEFLKERSALVRCAAAGQQA
jgi:pimeloyl-ACP methyl ester carboxylesterase